MSSTVSSMLIPCRFAVANFLTGKQFFLEVLNIKTNHIMDSYSKVQTLWEGHKIGINDKTAVLTQ